MGNIVITYKNVIWNCRELMECSRYRHDSALNLFILKWYYYFKKAVLIFWQIFYEINWICKKRFLQKIYKFICNAAIASSGLPPPEIFWYCKISTASILDLRLQLCIFCTHSVFDEMTELYNGFSISWLGKDNFAIWHLSHLIVIQSMFFLLKGCHSQIWII